MHYRRAGLAVTTLLACVFSTARADVLEMPAPQEEQESPAQTAPQDDDDSVAPLSPEAAGIDAPSRGMSMDQVANRYGQPLEKLGPVGDPPITRWVYADYTVYFEYKYVIHSVLNRD